MARTSTDDRLRSARLLAAAVAAVLLVLALAEGGFAPAVAGAATASVWLLIAIGIVSGALRADGLSAAGLAAAAALLGVAAFTALSLEWTGDKGAALEELVLTLGYLGAFGLVLLVARPGRGGPWLAAIALAGAGVAGLALASRLLGIGGDDQELAGLLPAAAGRLSYPLGYWNALGALVAVSAPALLWLALEGRSRPGRAAALAALPPLALVIFLTSSRGAVLAALLAVGIAVGFAADRRRALALALGAGAAALVPIAAVATQSRVIDGPGGTLGGPEALVLAATAIACLGLVRWRGRLEQLAERPAPAPLGLRRGPAVGIALLALAAAVAAVGPSTLLGEFRDTGPPAAGGARDLGPALVSGSGRAQFWQTAIDAFRDDPLRGVGAGGYASYWNANGSLDVATANAHSAPLEAFAELGLIGGSLLLAWAGVALAVGWRRAAGGRRAAPSPAAGAALGVLFGGLLVASIDWTWQMPAAFAPVVIAAGLLCSGALAGEPRDRPPRSASTAGWPARAGLVGLAVAAIWVAGLVAVTGARLDASDDALARGDLPAAADSARAAATISPWAAAPRLQLATIEQSAGNLEAARRAAIAGIERAPDDFRGWLALAEIEAALGEEEAGAPYLARAYRLAPRVLPRALQDRGTPAGP